MENEGKRFEHDYRDSAKKEGVFFLRLNDTFVTNQKLGFGKYTKTNPCDCILFYQGHLFPCEQKSTEYKSISFDRGEEEGKMIRWGQIKALTEFSQFDDVEPGFIFNFRGQEDEEPITYWVSIEDFNDFYNSTDKKSINKLDVACLPHTLVVPQTTKRTHSTYGVKELLEKILNKKGEKTID